MKPAGAPAGFMLMENLLLIEIRSNELTVIFYVAVLMAGTVFTTLFFVYAARGNDGMLASVRNFSLTLLLCTVSDFILTYFSLLSEGALAEGMAAYGGLPHSALIAAMFATDAVYFFMIVCWVFAVESLYGGFLGIAGRRLVVFGTAVYAACAEAIVAASMARAEDGMELLGGAPRNALLSMNLAFDACMLGVAVWLATSGLAAIVRERSRWRVFIAPVLLALCLAYYMGGTAVWDYRIVSSGVMSPEDMQMIDPMALICLLLCMLLVIFLHSRGHYIMGAGDPGRMSPDDVDARRAALTERHDLTARESEVLGLVLNGMSNTAIARELFISEHTVKRHVYAIFKKTGAKRRYELLSGRPR
jgi:DNA-binding CsgD family transcriptional regulator